MLKYCRWMIISSFAASAVLVLPGCGGGDGNGELGNNPPVANADSYTIRANDATTRLSVLDNDTSAPDQNETLTVLSVSQPLAGLVTLPDAPATGVNFRPESNFTGLATFTYTISDGRGGVASATVSVVVTPRDIAPAGTLPERTTSGGLCAASQTFGGAYGLVDQCITVSNPSATTVTIPIPAGLIFESEDRTVQDAIVVQDYAIVLAPGETKTVRVLAFCMNESREPARATGTGFLRRGVTTNPGLLRIISSIRGKVLDGEAKLDGLQSVIWQMIKNGSLTPEEESILQSI